MSYWLVKCEPDHDYSYQDLEKDGQTYWDGVTNNWALKFIHLSVMPVFEDYWNIILEMTC